MWRQGGGGRRVRAKKSHREREMERGEGKKESRKGCGENRPGLGEEGCRGRCRLAMKGVLVGRKQASTHLKPQPTSIKGLSEAS